MDNDNHKKIWNNFTKFVLWGSVVVIIILILMAIFSYKMIIGSILENIKLEQVALTLMIKKYKSLGLEVHLSKNYAIHLGISDKEYESEGAVISNSDEILSTSRAILQMNILSDEN